MQYILYVSRAANFQSRTMLIPRDEFIKVRQEEYNLLKEHAKPVTFLFDADPYTVDQVLYINYQQLSEDCWVQITTPYLKIVNELTSYADGMDHYDHDTDKFVNCYFKMEDQIWYDLAKTNLSGGFDHVLNHKRLLQKYPKIVESFLVLE